jgi:hypothetical protein
MYIVRSTHVRAPPPAELKVFFLGSEFLPLVTGINGYHKISKISAIYRAS